MSRHPFLFLMILAVGCTSAASSPWPAARADRYLREHPSTPQIIAEAMQRGHVVAGMNHEQVLVAAGEPRRRTRWPDGRESWLYRAAQFHQDQSAHGASLAKVHFTGGRVDRIDFF